MGASPPLPGVLAAAAATGLHAGSSWARISLVTLDRDHVTSPPTLGTVKALLIHTPPPPHPYTGPVDGGGREAAAPYRGPSSGP